MNPVSDFTNWTAICNTDLKEVEHILGCPISDQPEELIAQLTEIEAYNGRIGYLLAQAESHLDKCSFLLLPPKGEITEQERKISLDNAVSEMRKWRNRIDSISDAIRTRITLGQSILKYQVMFLERNIVQRQPI